MSDFISNPMDSFMKLRVQGIHIPLVKAEGMNDKELLKACQDFEAVFLHQMLKEMRKTVPKEGIIPESNEQDVFTTMFDEEVAKTMSKQGGFGLAEMLFEQLRDKSKDKKSGSDGVIINGTKYYTINRNR